jgi:hypothetical protein
VGGGARARRCLVATDQRMDRSVLCLCFFASFFLFGLVIDADVSLAHLLVLIYSANILQHCIAG